MFLSLKTGPIIQIFDAMLMLIAEDF